MQTQSLRKLLKGLQHQVRSEAVDAASHIGRTRIVPANLRTPEAQMLHVGPGVSRTIHHAAVALQADLEYEHLEDKADDAVWEFVCRSALQRDQDHVASFLRDHAKEPRQVKMLFGVDNLTVAESFVVQDAELLTLPEASSLEGAHLRQDPSCGSVVKLAVTGTSSDRMIERGRMRAQDVLRVLRISLAKCGLLHRWQLRFKLSELYVILGQLAGFKRHEDRAITLDMPHPPHELFSDFALLGIPHANQNGAQKQASLALKWIDQARLAIDPLHQVTFLFSALEATLGEVSGSTKARPLVFYRTVLGQAVNGRYSDPLRLYYLYDKVRSYAIHGEQVSVVVADKDIHFLEWSIRDALFEYVDFYERYRLVTRKQVRRALLQHADARPVYEWLRANDPEGWFADWSPWNS